MNEVKEHVENWLVNLLNEAFEKYGLVIACLVIGIIIGWLLKRFLADPKYRKQINLRFAEKDERIARLSFLVHERLSQVTVQKQDKSFFGRMKKFFKNFKTED